jgi:hypothetical protein
MPPAGGAIDLRQNPQPVLHRERPAARPMRQFRSCCRRGWHGGRPPAFHRANPCGAIQLRVFDWHNHVISVLRPEAKLFGLRCLMIIGTERIVDLVAVSHGKSHPARCAIVRNEHVLGSNRHTQPPITTLASGCYLVLLWRDILPNHRRLPHLCARWQAARCPASRSLPHPIGGRHQPGLHVGRVEQWHRDVVECILGVPVTFVPPLRQ